MSRRTWRHKGKREFKRQVRGKMDAFFSLYYQGFSKQAIASKLGMDLEAVEQLFEVVEPHEAIVNEGGRGA